MPDRIWVLVGQVGTLLAGIAAVTTVIVLLRSPSNLLVADIYPMGFALPISYKDIDSQVKPGPMHDSLVALAGVFSPAKGLVRIHLQNTGELQVTDIRVKVADAVLYAKEVSGALDNAEIIPFDQSGIKLGDMRQGDSITIYSWTKTPLEIYQFWNELPEKFQITFPQGIATKHVYIENNLFEGWFERNWGYIFGVSWVLFMILAVWFAWFAQSQSARSKNSESSASTGESGISTDV